MGSWPPPRAHAPHGNGGGFTRVPSCSCLCRCTPLRWHLNEIGSVDISCRVKHIIWVCHEQREAGMLPCGFIRMVLARNPEGKPAPVSAPQPRGASFPLWGHSALKQPPWISIHTAVGVLPPHCTPSAPILGFHLELASGFLVLFCVTQTLGQGFSSQRPGVWVSWGRGTPFCPAWRRPCLCRPSGGARMGGALWRHFC